MDSDEIRDGIVSRVACNGMVSFSFLKVMLGIESNLLTYYLDGLIKERVIDRTCRATYRLVSLRNYFEMLRSNN